MVEKLYISIRCLLILVICAMHTNARRVAGMFQERAVDPASASLALFEALPSSIQAIDLTNPAGAASIISSEFATGIPIWFTKLPADVQTYFITAAAAAVPTAAKTTTRTAFPTSQLTTTTPPRTTTSTSTTFSEISLPTALSSKTQTSTITIPDFTFSGTTSRTPQTTTIYVAPTTFVSSTTSSSSIQTDTRNNGLSLGAKAGIGISVPVMAIALVALGFIVFNRYRSQLGVRQSTSIATPFDLPEVVPMAAAPQLLYRGQ